LTSNLGHVSFKSYLMWKDHFMFLLNKLNPVKDKATE